MTTANRKRPPARRPAVPETRPLCEAALPLSGRVDRDKGVIYGVKVHGWDSENGHSYDPDGCPPSLYEGKFVNVNHPRKPGESYPSEDRFGRVVNVRRERDGLYGDLEYLKTHPLADRVCEAAERMPGAFGLSHHATRYERDTRNRSRIRRVLEVHSVDLVADPATTNGLFESQRTMKTITARALIESLAKRHPLVKPLLEDDSFTDMPVAEPAADGDGDYKADLLAALGKALDDESDDGKKVVDAIMKILKPAAAKAAADPIEEDEGEGDKKGKDDDDKDKDEPKLESLQREAATNRLCRVEKFTPSDALFEALCALPTDAKRKAVIVEAKAFAAGKPKPRSQSPGGGDPAEPLTESAVPKSDAAILEWLRG